MNASLYLKPLLGFKSNVNLIREPLTVAQSVKSLNSKLAILSLIDLTSSIVSDVFGSGLIKFTW